MYLLGSPFYLTNISPACFHSKCQSMCTLNARTLILIGMNKKKWRPSQPKSAGAKRLSQMSLIALQTRLVVRCESVRAHLASVSFFKRRLRTLILLRRLERIVLCRQ
jgi:hypothetical protein